MYIKEEITDFHTVLCLVTFRPNVKSKEQT